MLFWGRLGCYWTGKCLRKCLRVVRSVLGLVFRSVGVVYVSEKGG